MARNAKSASGAERAAVMLAAMLALLMMGFAAAAEPSLYRLEFDRTGRIGGTASGGPYQLVEFGDEQALPGGVEPGSVSAATPLLIEKPLEVTTPNGGESFLQYASVDVRWRIQPEFAGELVNIELYRNGSFLYFLKIGADSTADSHAVVDLGATMVGDGYKIRVTSIFNQNIYDESDASFRVVGDPSRPSAVATPDWTLYE